ncbi:MAG: peptide deformylase [Micrococcales bacterium]
MAVREIRLFGDPVLKTESAVIQQFDEGIQALVTDLLDTTALPGRAGVAAPQIGVNLRAFSYNVNGEIGYLLNPKITSLTGQIKLVDEGCLSVPGLWHKTPRYEHATAVGFDLAGNEIEIKGSGLLAQALQHECDHLDGLLYLDRLEPDERKIAMRALRETDWFLKN